MNPHDPPIDDPKNEEQIASILKTTEADAAPPDADALARLRAQSTEAFAHQAKAGERKRLMLFRNARWLGAAAAAILVGVGIYFWFTSQASALTLSKVLENAEKADTLHVRGKRDDKPFEFWHANKPNRSRLDHLDGTYRIENDSAIWNINENANQKRRIETRPDDRPFRGGILAPLLIHDVRAAILDSQPVQRVVDGEEEILTYRADNFWLECHLAIPSRRVVSIRTWLEMAEKKIAKGELKIIAYDEPIAADKFAVADTLTEDGRIGKVTDVQGIVAIKPVLHERWTPVHQHLVLKPGDWLRTDARGANAAALRLVKNTGIILGPRTLVELIGPKKIRLIEGEIEVTPTAGAAIELLGPGLEKLSVKGRQFYRVAKNQQFVRVAKDPAWLLGFKGITTNESLGSLVALVDGRNVPLTVGYHKVQVDIRDQIARTVVEESFVNSTDGVLEGVFHFPLPADASISGFGMWIGDNLVEADVVEKQRAREIYETILREKRDPGLLEWSGGNIFKARVYPIPARSEKRIKITYTQVLPLKGNRYRYSYALQSELLQQHPLRNLSIDVKVNSAALLKSVSSPTHATRDDKTAHSGHVEFTAQEYTPTRDFEVVVETEGRQADVVMIPHRRGDDGYFLLQLTPPGAAGDWDRPILPNGEPLRLLILADTSASIDAGQRATQATFIASLLSSLTPKDTFNLATCDVTCDWAFVKSLPADANNIAAAREFLDKRASLGWTDLDRTFAAALKQCTPNTHVIYVGDGIVTTADADPVAFTKRLRRLANGQGGVFHAVTVGSSFEAGVMKTIASLGSGSLRKISNEQGPTAVARELLGEIAQPALRDIKVEFKGIRAARVYPETLANVPAGTQQILLGRYLPEGKDQSGEVIVTGTQAGKPVRFSTRVSLKDAELGNSFIPRLWARMHLDSLLEQGASETIKDEIISLSEEYQIITPYTSFLVLETDADRERFKVKRRFLMRDGERFFADGRDNAVFELAQKQMKKASAWRTALRRTVLSELARLGREPRLFQPHYGRPYGGRRLAELSLGDANEMLGIDLEGAMPAVPGGGGAIDIDGPMNQFGVPMEEPSGGEWAERKKDVSDLEELFDTGGKRESQQLEGGLAAEPEGVDLPAPHREDRAGVVVDGTYGTYGFLTLANGEMDFKSIGGLETFGRSHGPYYGNWINTLFPTLPAAPRKPKEIKSTWPAAARELAKSLLRTEQLAKLQDGVEIVRQSDSFDVRWEDLSSRSRRLELVSAKSWLTRSRSDGGQAFISWCDDKQIGTYSTGFQLGRVRASTPLDLQPPTLELNDHSLVSLEREFANYTPTIEAQGKDRALLILKHPTSPEDETRILIDTDKHVIVSIDNRHKNKSTGLTKFDDFVQAGGSWWARKIESTDENGKRSSLVTQTVKSLTAEELQKQMKAELSGRTQVQFLELPLPTLAQAKKALASGQAAFGDRFVLLFHFLGTQQWQRVFDHLQGAEKLAGAKPGMRWLRSALLRDARRHEELQKRFQEDAARLVKNPSADAYFLVEYLVNQSSGVLETNEMLALLDLVRPLYDKEPAHVHARQHWLQQRVRYLNQAGRTDEALRLWKQIAEGYPRDYSLQQQYAQALASAGDYPAAYAWLTRVLVKESKWRDYEEDYLRSAYTQFLQQEGRYADLVKYVAAWVDMNPKGHSAYEQYLGALIKTDQIERADALALAWLKDAQIPGELPAPVASRLSAAVQFMLGNAYHFNTNRIEERFLAPLGEAALYFARHKTNASTAEQILSNYQFQRSEEAPRVRKKLAEILSAEIDQMPAEQARRLTDWVQYDDAAPAAWTKIAASLRKRWNGEAKEDVKHKLGQALINVLSRQDSKDLLAFLRVQLEQGPPKHRADYANQLFDNLLGQPWSAKFENEALVLLERLSDVEEPGARLFASVAALYRFTDRMLDNRIAFEGRKLEHPEKLTRTELLKKQEADRRLARESLADRLRKDSAKFPKALGNWLIAESVYLDVQLDRNLKAAADAAWVFVGAAPPKKTDDEPTAESVLESLLRQRYLVTLMNLAARKGAAPESIDRLLKYIDQGISAEPDSNRWKMAKYRFLVAVDRAKDLEQTLTQWARQNDPDNRWRVALGYLLAEQGKLAEAIREFEAVESADELRPAEYRALADWYLTQNRRELYERAGAMVYKTMPEYRLSQMIAVKLQPWQARDGRLPAELDKEVLRQFTVLFEKSEAPQNYLWQLQQFYQASHDFRLLSMLPDAVIGHTAMRVYPFVQGMDGVLSEVRDEATADEIVKRIAEVRPRAKTLVDKRALDLLEVLIERRAAEVVNQPGPHRERALAALVRASKGEWSDGEPHLVADFLAGLGKITQAALADEQLRQLKALRLAGTGRGTQDSLHIAYRHATTLNAYNRRAEAIDLLEAELNDFQAANKGVLPTSANEAVGTLIDFLEAVGHFARAEKYLQDQRGHPVHAQQSRWLIDRLNHVYLHALGRDGDVSLGKGQALYQALSAKIHKELADTDQTLRYQLINMQCQVYRTATEKKLAGVKADVRAFAFEFAPPLLKQQTNNHENLVSTIAHTVRELVGPREAIEFLLNEIDAQPRWLRYNNQDGWSRQATALADWRLEAKDLGAVENRLLKLVLAELRRDLETREPRNRSMYFQHSDRDRFWKEKAADFAKTAEAVLAQRNKSGASVLYIADYFYSGLDRPKRAIEILLVAYSQKLLDEQGQAKLVDYLHRQGRYGESIAILQPLVERRPGNLDYRVLLMHAYFRTDRKMDLLDLLKATDKYFHEKDRWGENPLDRLARSTLENELFEQSVAYFKELIPLHERTQPHRGVGNGTLSMYYTGLANAYAGLKKASEAVDAASGAIVAWGPRHANRTQALDTLTSILVRAPDLDAFVGQFDQKKEDSAVIRKAIGQAYHQKRDYAKAIAQLHKAAELQPNDTEIYALLVTCYDKIDDNEGAIQTLLQAVQLSRRELKLYEDLGKRYAEANQKAQAERAYTSIVEMQPHEAESHALLAEIRQKENRWPEAIKQWEHVASLRALEPTGLVKLAEAQIHEKQWDAARATLRRLRSRTWPPRFSEYETREAIRRLAEKLPR